MGLYFRNGAWYLDLYVEGRRVRERIGTNRREAERALAARRGEVLQRRYTLADRVQAPRFIDAAAAYQQYSEANKRSARRDRFLLKQLVAAFGSSRLDEITPWQIEEFKARRRRQVTPASVNRELACLKHLFTLAIGWGQARENPVKRVRFLREDNHVERILSEEEEARLLEAASPRLRPILVVALNTGLRHGECLALRWEHVDLVTGALHVRQSKSGRSRTVPLNRIAMSALQSLRGAGASGAVFQMAGRPVRSIRNAFDRARVAAGLQDVRFHDLRHTFATRLVLAGIDLVTVSRLLGHSTITMTLRYAHPAPADLQRAVASLEESRGEVCEAYTQYRVRSARAK